MAAPDGGDGPVFLPAAPPWRRQLDDSSPNTDFALDTDQIRERIAALKDGGDFETIEGRLYRHLLMADALSGVAAALIWETAIEEISDMVLACAKALTESSAGYAGYIDSKTGHLVCPTMTRDVWQICEVPEKDIVFRRFGGLWGWVLKNRKPLMTNDPAADDRAGGVPDGHIPIERFLSVPALFKDRLVGQIALANASRDYGQEDLAFVTRLAEW